MYCIYTYMSEYNQINKKIFKETTFFSRSKKPLNLFCKHFKIQIETHCTNYLFYKKNTILNYSSL